MSSYSLKYHSTSQNFISLSSLISLYLISCLSLVPSMCNFLFWPDVGFCAPQCILNVQASLGQHLTGVSLTGRCKSLAACCISCNRPGVWGASFCTSYKVNMRSSLLPIRSSTYTERGFLALIALIWKLMYSREAVKICWPPFCLLDLHCICGRFIAYRQQAKRSIVSKLLMYCRYELQRTLHVTEKSADLLKFSLGNFSKAFAALTNTPCQLSGIYLSGMADDSWVSRL